MTSNPFLPADEKLIQAEVVVGVMYGDTDDEITRHIIDVAKWPPNQHDYDQVLAQVKSFRARMSQPGTPGPTRSTPPVPQPPFASGNNWGSRWSSFTSNIGATISSAGAGATAIGGSIASAFTGAPGMAGSIWSSVTNWSNAPRGSFRARFSPRARASARRWRYSRAKAAWWRRGAGPSVPRPAPPKPQNPRPTASSLFGNNAGIAGGTIGWNMTGNRPTSRIGTQLPRPGAVGQGGLPTPVNDWLTAMLMPRPQTAMGSLAGYAGATAGFASAGPLGEFLGQAAGTVLGDFVSKMKDAVTQARDFAGAVKESNRSLMYYNGSIAGSFVQADVASMYRNMRLAAELAPSTNALNEQITRYDDTTFFRSALKGNFQNEKAGFFLGMAQQVANLAQPIEKNLYYAYQYISPLGDLGSRVGANAAKLAVGVGAQILTNLLTPGIGPMLASIVSGAVPGLMDKLDKPDVAPKKAGPWENLFMNQAAAFPAGKGIVNAKKLDPKRRSGRF